ncbi:P-loop containing nucleoside triphosphate hydrolase protein [Phycomyces blakesleeanus]
MLSKIFVPSVARLTGQRAFTQLSRQVLSPARVSQAQSIFRSNQNIGHHFKDLKYTPYAFMHTEAALNPIVAEVEDIVSEIPEEVIVSVEETVPEVSAKKRFDSIEAINPVTQRTLSKLFKYEEMSPVQEAVLSKLPNTNDMFVKAKTGTGKTLAFLIAAIETAMAGKTPKDLQYFEGTSIMIISPTRELANQIADEAAKLCSHYPFKVHCMVGGDSKRRQIMGLERRRCDIVVATPGRLNDMLSSVPNFKKMCENLKVLVLDEADQLLDMGFKAELQRIFANIPEERQTMLYSATISQDIRRNLGDFALSPKYDLIDTVGKDDNTHVHVKQSALVAPYGEQLGLVRNLLTNYESANTGKVIVFLPTTKSTILYSHLFKMLMPNRTIYEIHSKKTQEQRTRISDRFRKTSGGILFTSDISARGVDYPGVSLVLQVGVPSTREQYIHRLGRTGRAGREGEGVILLAPFEKDFLKREIGDLPVQNLIAPTIADEDIEATERLTKAALNSIDEDMVREVYTGFLGYYAGRVATLGLPRASVVEHANDFLRGFGITDIPHLSPRFLAQLGLGGGGGSRNGGGSGGFRSREGGFRSREGGFAPREGGFRPREGGFRSRDNNSSEGGFRSREGGFRSRDNNSSEGGFRSREGGFRSRDNNSSEGGFRSREGGFRGRQ